MEFQDILKHHLRPLRESEAGVNSSAGSEAVKGMNGFWEGWPVTKACPELASPRRHPQMEQTDTRPQEPPEQPPLPAPTGG